MSTGSMALLIGSTLVRVLIGLSSTFGFFPEDSKSFNLVGKSLQEARELASSTNSRILLFSWPILGIVSLFTRSDQLCSGIKPINALYPLGIASLLCLFFIFLPTTLFRGTAPTVIILIVITCFDLFFAVRFLDPATLYLCTTPLKP
jgi:uncharacterized membrane protein